VLDLNHRSASDLAALVQTGELSAIAVVEAFFDRIAAEDGRVRAFASVRDREAVRAEARALMQRGDRRELALAGVPIAVKDVLAVAGLPCRAGSRATSPAPSVEDAELVARVRRAGALVVGTTTMPELGLFGFTAAEVYGGPTANPWDLARTPGGSSGGSAAAVAGKMAALAIGTDGLGSVRIPAACCGLVGLKPGPGIVPQPPSPWFGQTEFGPLATTVADAALLLGVLAGRPIRPEPRGRLRVAFWQRPPVPGLAVDDDIQRITERCAGYLADMGHDVRGGAAPRPVELAVALFLRWVAAAAADVDRLGLDPAALERNTRVHVRLGQQVLRRRPPQAAESERARTVLRETLSAVEVVLCPTLAQRPPMLGECDASWPRFCYRQLSFAPFTALWNLAQYPAITVPAGLDRAGMPVGVMLAGGPGSEPVLLGLAAQLEELAPWPRHPPRRA
jgi:amidase